MAPLYSTLSVLGEVVFWSTNAFSEDVVTSDFWSANASLEEVVASEVWSANAVSSTLVELSQHAGHAEHMSTFLRADGR